MFTQLLPLIYIYVYPTHLSHAGSFFSGALEVASAEVVQVRRELADAQAAAEATALELGKWRKRCTLWKSRAGLWRKRAERRAGDASDETSGEIPRGEAAELGAFAAMAMTALSQRDQVNSTASAPPPPSALSQSKPKHL